MYSRAELKFPWTLIVMASEQLHEHTAAGIVDARRCHDGRHIESRDPHLFLRNQIAQVVSDSLGIGILVNHEASFSERPLGISLVLWRTTPGRTRDKQSATLCKGRQDLSFTFGRRRDLHNSCEAR